MARVIGYEDVPVTLLEDTLPTQHRNEVIETEEKLRDLLIGAGLQDTVNYALTSPENHARLGLDYAPLGGVPGAGSTTSATLSRQLNSRSAGALLVAGAAFWARTGAMNNKTASERICRA